MEGSTFLANHRQITNYYRFGALSARAVSVIREKDKKV
jgi:hypothetical protein